MNRLILLIILSSLFFGYKLSRATAEKLQTSMQAHESQLEKAMLDLD